MNLFGKMKQLASKLEPIQLTRGETLENENDSFFLVVNGIISYAEKEKDQMKFSQAPFGLGKLSFMNKVVRPFSELRAMMNSLLMQLRETKETQEVKESF